MSFLVDWIRETLAVFSDTAPFLLFGFLLAGILRVVVPAGWLRRKLGRRGLGSVVRAALAGIPLPLCSCSVLPTAAALRRSGASKGAITSFVVATPETGVDSIALTYALMDPLMTVARPLAAFGSAIAAGVAIDALDRHDNAAPAEPDLPAPAEHATRGHACGPDEVVTGAGGPRRGSRVRGVFRYAYGELLDDIAPWFILGILLTGLIGALIPAGALENPAFRGFPAMLAMLLVGIPLYVCDISSTPLAAMLILKGISPGTVIVFLLAGPATNVTSIAVLTHLLGRRAVALYLAAIAVCALLAGFAVDAAYEALGLDAQAAVGIGREVLPGWIRLAASLVLAALLWRSAARIGLAQRWRASLRRIGRPLGFDFGGAGARAALALVLIALYLLTGCGTVGPGEVGWVLTFGRITRTVEAPGLVVHWPYPIARLEKESAARVRSVDRGFRQDQPYADGAGPSASSEEGQELIREAEIATGDENLLSLRYSVQYRVADPYVFHFALDEADRLVTSFAESALRRVMCTVETDTILVGHRMELARRAAEELNRDLAAIGAGVEALRVDLLDVHAPAEVHFSFRDVASAMEDNHRFIRQAESYRNRVLGAARGRAHRLAADSEGDRASRVAAAAGRGAGFTLQHAAYRRAPELTRLRLHLDAAGENLARARLILPLADLPLDLWLTRGARPLTDVLAGVGASAAPMTGPALPPETGTAPAPPSTETWRDKMNRMQQQEEKR